MDPILYFLKEGRLPFEANEAYVLKHKVWNLATPTCLHKGFDDHNLMGTHTHTRVCVCVSLCILLAQRPFTLVLMMINSCSYSLLIIL